MSKTISSTHDAGRPDLSGYYGVHQAIRVAGARLCAVAEHAAAHGRPLPDAVPTYWTKFSNELAAHHTGEDDVFFPALAERSERFADTLAGSLEAEHHELDELIRRADHAVMHGSAEEATHHLRAYERFMDRHLGVEDEQVLPLFDHHFTDAEYQVLEQTVVKRIGIGKQALFTVPFVLEAMSEPDRKALLAASPLPPRVVYRLGRRSYARLETAAFGSIDDGSAR